MNQLWLFNLDAELELEKGEHYVSSKATMARTTKMVEALRRTYCAEGDLVLGEVEMSGSSLCDYIGRSWCPTSRAQKRLREAGVKVPLAPSVEVLRRVNHRAFCAGLGQTLEHANFVYQLEEAKAVISHATPSGYWKLKRALGFSGRGQRRIAAGPLDDDYDCRWIEAALRRGDGVQIEPWVEREADFVIHGYLTSAGELSLGCPARQRCDEYGAWISTKRVEDGELGRGEKLSLEDAAREVADGLRKAGYFGPFGMDAFRYREEGGSRFNPRSEINARYTMGWVVGMGEMRPDLDF